MLLAIAFGFAGFTKLFGQMPELGEKMFWTKDVPLALVRFIGASELGAAIGLLLPAATRVKPILTAWAGAGLATVMVLAIVFHLMRGEAPYITGPLILGLLASFVAWGRFTRAPIMPRG